MARRRIGTNHKLMKLDKKGPRQFILIASYQLSLMIHHHTDLFTEFLRGIKAQILPPGLELFTSTQTSHAGMSHRRLHQQRLLNVSNQNNRGHRPCTLW